MNTQKYWPLDFDPEGEIYENLSWDLPGFRRNRKTTAPKNQAPRTRKQKPSGK